MKNLIEVQPKRNSLRRLLLERVRVVEGQALCRDVAVARAEGRPGIAVREAGRLEPMGLLVAVARGRSGLRSSGCGRP